MNTKKCSKCGWVYPMEWPGGTCRFCHGPLDYQRCCRCHKYVTKLYSGICIECSKAAHYEWVHKKKEQANDALSDWVSKISTQPTKPLTEEQWIKACKHFGGCAYCGNANIDVRSMFIRYKDGGRYCAWNIVPACERCETVRKSIHNPFLRMDQSFYRGSSDPAKKYGFSLENLQRIVEYLQSNMEVQE